MKIKSYQELFPISKITTGKPIVIFPGRFQPFHINHVRSFQRAYKEFGNIPVVILQIMSKNRKSPFPSVVLDKLAQDLINSYQEIEGFYTYPNTYGKTVIPNFVKFLRECGYEPIGVACGIDREIDYSRQVKFINSPDSDVIVKPSFHLKTVDDRKDNISSSLIRQLLIDGNQKEYERLTPKEIHRHYNSLRKHL